MISVVESTSKPLESESKSSDSLSPENFSKWAVVVGSASSSLEGQHGFGASGECSRGGAK